LRIALSLTLVLVPLMSLAAANVVSVVQKGRAFSVSTMQVVRGGVVRFVNDDLFLHQVYVDSSSFSFDTDEQEPGTTVEIQFPKAGLFEVRCHIHPKMLLQVEVR
jgi:plastocyanin